ncbi:MAG TPA: serine hydrolase domain-containing protein [Blastocatellia bacterium]|jgi:CubicO group peptidase (beta-lactamase class C family)|nr:serine hydrolase domain-containing protein [Blastocatellia bacterium]
MKRSFIALLFAFAVLLAPSPAAIGQTGGGSRAEEVELIIGKPVERELAGGGKHSYRVHLTSGQWLNAILYQRGIDVLVRVTSPQGKQLAEIDSPNGDEGPEPIFVTAESTGEYRIEVLPIEEKAAAGRYEIKIEQVRAAAKDPAGKVDQLFAQWDKPGSPGAAVAIIKDGQIIYKKGYGSANLEYDIPITPSTVFHVASVSKQFTAFAVAMLADQKKLSLDDDIRKYLPEVPDFGKKITIRHLIFHVSGLRDQWEMLAMGGWRLDDVITTAQILEMVSHEKELNFDPGQEMLYCNTGYTLLAEIVARVSGKSFRSYTEEAIFKPLGMTSSHFHDDHEMIVRNRAYSYAPGNGKEFKLLALNYATVGATSLFTTVEDLAKWVRNFDEPRAGNRAVIEQMYEVGVLNSGEPTGYAFGLAIGQRKGLKTVGHSGGDAGYRSYVTRMPDQKFAVVVLSNLATFNPGQLAGQIADIYLADQLKPERARAEEPKRADVPVAASVLKSYEGTYQIRPGFVLSVSVEDGHLMTQASGEEKVRAFAESESRFSAPSYGGPLEFVKNGEGRVDHLIYRGLRATRVVPFSPGLEKLADFTGDYYSAELGTTYTIAVEKGKLVAKHRRTGDVPLAPAFTDQFRGGQFYFRHVVFTRDGQNRVNGFRLTGGRVRNMRFDRQAAPAAPGR